MNSLNSLEWRQLNSTRNYPFTDLATLSFDEGFLPQNWILDARIYIRGNYEEYGPAYISKVVRNYESIVITVAASSGVILGEGKILLTDIVDVVDLKDAAILTGCLVIDPSRTSLVQSLPVGEYALAPTVAPLLAVCCEYLPAPQVQSVNGQAGHIRFTAEDGIKLTRVDSSTLKIDIVGDPHFNRHNCAIGASDNIDDALELSGLFLKRFKVIHYIKTSAGDLVGPYVSTLQRKADGSIVLALSTPVTTSQDPVELREARPAFRLTATGDAITLSLAGA